MAILVGQSHIKGTVAKRWFFVPFPSVKNKKE